MDAVAIVIEVGEPTDDALERAMVDACSDAIVEGRCGAAGKDAGGAEAHATVHWDTAHIEAGVDVVPFEGVTRSHTLHFQPQDPMIERWRSVGLIVGTLVGDARRARAAAPVEPPHPPPPVGSPSIAPPPAMPAKPAAKPSPIVNERFAIDLGILLGNGLEGGAPRVGASVRPSLLVPGTPLVPCFDVAFSARPPDALGVEARWLTIGGGLGVRAGLAERRVALEGRLEGIAEWTGASATDTAGASDAGGRWQPGVRADVGVAWMFSRSIGLVAGATGDVVPSGTVVRVHRVDVERSPPEHFAGYAGVRFGLF